MRFRRKMYIRIAMTYSHFNGYDVVDYTVLLALGIPVADTRSPNAARGLTMTKVTKA